MSDQSNIRVFEIAEIKKLNNQLAASACELKLIYIFI